MLANGASYSLFFGMYEGAKYKFGIVKGGMLAGTIATVIVCPIWVLKTRILLDNKKI